MCGRLNVTDNPLIIRFLKELGIDFTMSTNSDLRPSESVASIGSNRGMLSQINLNWGIKPEWSKRLLINAQSETVSTKKTFSHQFENFRCIVPCDGWYEWRVEGETRKQKYLLSHIEEQPLYMAGIWYPENNQLVTLTKKAEDSVSEIHHRMPVLIEKENINQWIGGAKQEAIKQLSLFDADQLTYKKAH